MKICKLALLSKMKQNMTSVTKQRAVSVVWRYFGSKKYHSILLYPNVFVYIFSFVKNNKKGTSLISLEGVFARGKMTQKAQH